MVVLSVVLIAVVLILIGVIYMRRSIKAQVIDTPISFNATAGVPAETKVLEIGKVALMADRPDSYLISQYYLPFAYVMPSDFSKSADLQLESFTAWQDDYNIKAV